MMLPRLRIPRISTDQAKPPDSLLLPVAAISATEAEFRPQKTRLMVTYDDSHLYVSFECADSDIWGTYSQRNDPLYEEEVVEAFLCPTGDLRHYYEFEVSPRNVVFDAKVFSPDLHRGTMQVDRSWDCAGLQTAVRVNGVLHTTRPDERPITITSTSTITNSHGQSWWSVEMAIPFAAFPEVNPPARGDVWRANFYRIDRAEPPEFTAWSPTLEDPPNFHVPERFGFLEFG